MNMLQTLTQIIETTPIALFDTNILKLPEQEGVLQYIRKTKQVEDKDLPLLEKHQTHIRYLKELCQHAHAHFIPEIAQEILAYSSALLTELANTNSPLTTHAKARALFEQYLHSVQTLEEISREQEIDLTTFEQEQRKHWIELEKIIAAVLPRKYLQQKQASTTDATLVATAFYSLQFGNVTIVSNDSDVYWLTATTQHFIAVIEKKEQTTLLPATLQIARYHKQREDYEVSFTTTDFDNRKTRYSLERRFNGEANLRQCWFTTYSTLKQALRLTRPYVPNFPILQNL